MKEERLPKIALDRYRGLSEEEKKEEKKYARNRYQISKKTNKN